ncbi:hypothetical protein CLV62_10813 [Dysgonomonas alginatilytica]|uniref:Uncharacterized protein n=1 Tax=Dysgonomonas alginatilytica TaxID=1605892 RepID=A0A2V3PRK5_9BACT|nr:hypothetical protein [Dysgonomonas alginatilytica]PXV65015.1 hypothetical protein CLV62_10813 [Dysgonomonas alginatilytica]
MRTIILVLFTLSLTFQPVMIYSQDSNEQKKEQREREKQEKAAKKAKEKEEKERKKKENGGKPKWAGLPEKMSGVKEVDAYILTVDSMYTYVKNYTDRINFYTQKTVPLIDANGEQIRSEDGQGYVKTEITDQDGNRVSITQLVLQAPDVLASLLGLTADATSVVAQGLSGGIAFISNPMAAFTHGKYLKDGPGVLVYIAQEGGRLYSSTKTQYDVLTKLRKSEVTQDFGLDINRDETIINTENDYAEAAGVENILEELSVE